MEEFFFFFCFSFFIYSLYIQWEAILSVFSIKWEIAFHTLMQQLKKIINWFRQLLIWFNNKSTNQGQLLPTSIEGSMTMTLTTSEEAVSVRDGYYMGPLYNWCLIQIQFLIPWKIETLTFIFHSKSHLFCWNVWNWLFSLNFMVKIQKFWFAPSDFVATTVVAALSSAKPELPSLGTTMRWKAQVETFTFLFTRRKLVVLFNSDSPNTDFSK